MARPVIELAQAYLPRSRALAWAPPGETTPPLGWAPGVLPSLELRA